MESRPGPQQKGRQQDKRKSCESSSVHLSTGRSGCTRGPLCRTFSTFRRPSTTEREPFVPRTVETVALQKCAPTGTSHSHRLRNLCIENHTRRNSTRRRHRVVCKLRPMRRDNKPNRHCTLLPLHIRRRKYSQRGHMSPLVGTLLHRRHRVGQCKPHCVVCLRTRRAARNRKHPGSS